MLVPILMTERSETAINLRSAKIFKTIYGVKRTTAHNKSDTNTDKIFRFFWFNLITPSIICSPPLVCRVRRYRNMLNFSIEHSLGLKSLH